MNRLSIKIHTTRLACMALLTAGLIGLAGAASAQVYRWTDDSGRVVVSDTPPPTGKSQKILKSAPQAEAQKSNGEAKQKTLDPEVAKRISDREKQEKAGDEARQKAMMEYCESAKEALAQLESGDRIVKRGPSGARTYMTNEQRAEEISKLRKNMQEQKCP